MQSSSSCNQPIENKRIYTPEERRHHVTAWRNSKLSMSDFCREHDLNVSTFYGWSQRIKPENKLSFQPVETTPPEIPKENPPASTLLSLDEPLTINMTLTNGIKLNLGNIKTLSTLSHLIKELQSCN